MKPATASIDEKRAETAGDSPRSFSMSDVRHVVWRAAGRLSQCEGDVGCEITELGTARRLERDRCGERVRIRARHDALDGLRERVECVVGQHPFSVQRNPP